MAVILDRGPHGVQGWFDDLRTRLRDPVVRYVLPPLAAAQIDRPAADFLSLLDRREAPRDDAEQFALFALARAGIHLSHVVGSPWYFSFTRDVSRRARWAAHWQASRRPLASGEELHAKTDFATLAGTLYDTSEAFCVHEIVETHAIVEGLRSSMARPSAIALYHLALELYREQPTSLRLLSHLAGLFDIELAVALIPRLCVAALRFPFPAIALGDLIASLEQNRRKVDQLVEMPAERFFTACRLDANVAARSARERAAGAPFNEADAWSGSIRTYFDRYEALSSDEARLQAALHPMQAAPQSATTDGPPLFEPAWLLFPDDQVGDLQPQPGTFTDFARWLADVLGLLEGLAWLGGGQSVR